MRRNQVESGVEYELEMVIFILDSASFIIVSRRRTSRSAPTPRCATTRATRPCSAPSTPCCCDSDSCIWRQLWTRAASIACRLGFARKLTAPSLREQCQLLLKQIELDPATWRVGKTLVFMASEGVLTLLPNVRFVLSYRHNLQAQAQFHALQMLQAHAAASGGAPLFQAIPQNDLHKQI